MISKRKIVIMSLAVLAVAACLMSWRAYANRGSGPFYKNRRLSVWLEGYRRGAWQQSEEAMKALGTNALPTLITLLRRGANPQQLSSFAEQDQTGYAIRACEALGPVAAPALPELKNCFFQPEYACFAPNALAALGADGVSVVIGGLTNNSKHFQQLRHCCAETLEHVGPAGSNAVPSLLICLTNKDRMLRAQAARSLGCIRMYPDVVVPALVATLHDKDTWVRESAIYGLGQLKAAAKPAVPALLECLKEDPNGRVFFMARAWLHEIDIEALRKSGFWPPGVDQ